jgi:hypothetical protein
MLKTILAVIGVVLAYGISFGRIFTRFRGDKIHRVCERYSFPCRSGRGSV